MEIEVAVLGSPSLIVRMVSADLKQNNTELELELVQSHSPMGKKSSFGQSSVELSGHFFPLLVTRKSSFSQSSVEMLRSFPPFSHATIVF